MSSSTDQSLASPPPVVELVTNEAYPSTIGGTNSTADSTDIAINTKHTTTTDGNGRSVAGDIQWGKIGFCLTVSVLVSAGEAAVAAYFWGSYWTSLAKKSSGFFSPIAKACANPATFWTVLIAAFLLSVTLFYLSMEETLEKLPNIGRILIHGKYSETSKTEEKEEAEQYRYSSPQRFAIFMSWVFAVFAAFTVGALAYNAILSMKSHGGIGIQAFAIAVWLAEVIASTCVFNIYFADILKYMFDTANKEKEGLIGRLKDYCDEIGCYCLRGELAGKKKQNAGKLNRFSPAYISRLAGFWLPIIILDLAAMYISYRLFVSQVRQFSKSQFMQKMPFTISPQMAIAITVIAMVVTCPFRWKSLWQIAHSAFHKKKDSTREVNTSTKLARYVIVFAFIGFVFAAINGAAQGLGCLVTKLPSGFFSSKFALVLYFVAITLASAGANGKAFYQCATEKLPQVVKFFKAPLCGRDSGEETTHSSYINMHDQGLVCH
jgi:hypothetical protein